MLGLARWCIAHRRRVVVGWVAVAILTTVVAQAVAPKWTRHHDASAAVGDGIALTGRVNSAAAAIMVCVFLSFTLGNQRTLKEFGFGLAVAVFLDALVVRCVLLPAVLELLGPRAWWLPRWLDARLPRINIEGTTARTHHDPQPILIDDGMLTVAPELGAAG